MSTPPKTSDWNPKIGGLGRCFSFSKGGIFRFHVSFRGRIAARNPCQTSLPRLSWQIWMSKNSALLILPSSWKWKMASYLKGNYYWRDSFFTSMIVGGRVVDNLLSNLKRGTWYLPKDWRWNLKEIGTSLEHHPVKKPDELPKSRCVAEIYVGAFVPSILLCNNDDIALASWEFLTMAYRDRDRFSSFLFFKEWEHLTTLPRFPCLVGHYVQCADGVKIVFWGMIICTVNDRNPEKDRYVNPDLMVCSWPLGKTMGEF